MISNNTNVSPTKIQNMCEAIFDNIKISKIYADGNNVEIYEADMHIGNKTIQVQLQKGYNGCWRAVGEKNETVYEMNNIDKASIDDWRDGDEVEITDTILRNPN